MLDFRQKALERFDADWPQALRELSEDFHPVDRDACRIWFQFYPLGLRELLAGETEKPVLEEFYQLRGKYRLEETADTSHVFLYGHRYWPEVKRELAVREIGPRAELTGLIREVARKVHGPAGLTLPVTAVGVMTLRQVGGDFLAKDSEVRVEKRTAEQVLRDRATDAKAGFLAKKKTRVVFDERAEDGWFPIIPTQHITAGAEADKRPHHEKDSRCYIGNGPIPVDCRSGTCGTCWVGVIGGNERLEPVEEFERKRMEYFGYWENPFHEPRDARPPIRLACQTVALGSCSIVIPAWNGVWGKARREAFARRYVGDLT